MITIIGTPSTEAPTQIIGKNGISPIPIVRGTVSGRIPTHFMDEIYQNQSVLRPFRLVEEQMPFCDYPSKGITDAINCQARQFEIEARC
jgi:hypothetical protein